MIGSLRRRSLRLRLRPPAAAQLRRGAVFVFVSIPILLSVFFVCLNVFIIIYIHTFSRGSTCDILIGPRGRADAARGRPGPVCDARAHRVGAGLPATSGGGPSRGDGGGGGCGGGGSLSYYYYYYFYVTIIIIIINICMLLLLLLLLLLSLLYHYYYYYYYYYNYTYARGSRTPAPRFLVLRAP